MQIVDTVIVGAGQAGLALSASLTARAVDHVVLERGRIGERWRSERWDSLRLLTPNWMNALPGGPRSDDPDGYMTAGELVTSFERHARSFGAPVREGVTVRGVHEASGGFLVETDGCGYLAHNVVVATGFCDLPHVPDVAASLPDSVWQVHAAGYKNPDQLPGGAVLVVGAGASGIQIAAELRRSGRGVLLSAGSHARAVRRYRGQDVWWWFDRIGSLDLTVDDVPDIEAARRQPSLGLTGANGGEDVDFGILRTRGVRLAGRLQSVDHTRLRFADDLSAEVEAAEERLRRLLDRFDASARIDGLDRVLPPPMRPDPVRVDDPVREADLEAWGIRSVVWATGYRRRYPWLTVPVLDEAGEIVHRRGVTPVPGLYVLGMRFLWSRRSHFIDGVGADAEHLAEHIAARQEAPVTPPALLAAGG